jgi:hypothetical protein
MLEYLKAATLITLLIIMFGSAIAIAAGKR